MTLSQLRSRHPRLIYQDFEVKPDGKNLSISFNFLLEPDIRFRPEISIPVSAIMQESPDGRQETPEKIKNLVFNLGLVEAISYWKAACPPEFIVKAGYLSPGQIAWWKHLFIHGLGEFFFRNNIDFTAPNFLSIVTQPSSRVASSSPRAQPRGPVSEANDINIANARSLDFARDDESMSGDLILVGGGKDSIVTLEILKQLSGRKTALMVNPGPNSLSAARIAGYKNSIIVTRKIDGKLLQLNKLGYLNGHTPFSAYLAFLGVLVAYLHGYKNVISSNELGAGEASLIYKSMEINHQYSKSFVFEKLFREYCSKYLFINQESPRRTSGRLLANTTVRINYFSFLRPLYELQIARLFSNFPSSRVYDSVFISCNAGRGKFWCGRCPKCAFNYLSLFPFMSKNRLMNIFKAELFEKSEIQKHILDLVGLGQYKPFDCVGTKEESILAATLAIRKINRQQAVGSRQQEFLLKLEQKLNLANQKAVKKLERKIMDNWSDQNFVPPDYSKILNRSLLTSSGDS